MEDLSWQLIAGQGLSLLALGLCIAAFSSKQDDRLLLMLIFANIAFALHFVLLGSWTAAVLTVLIVLRIVLARRYKGSWPVTLWMLAANFGAAALTWQGMIDVFPLTAALLGTIAMFLLRGIPMRLLLAAAALAWTLNNLVLGSIGGVIAEVLVLSTNLVTVIRLYREGDAPGAATHVSARRLIAPDPVLTRQHNRARDDQRDTQ